MAKEHITEIVVVNNTAHTLTLHNNYLYRGTFQSTPAQAINAYSKDTFTCYESYMSLIGCGGIISYSMQPHPDFLPHHFASYVHIAFKHHPNLNRGYGLSCYTSRADVAEKCMSRYDNKYLSLEMPHCGRALLSHWDQSSIKRFLTLRIDESGVTPSDFIVPVTEAEAIEKDFPGGLIIE